MRQKLPRNSEQKLHFNWYIKYISAYCTQYYITKSFKMLDLFEKKSKFSQTFYKNTKITVKKLIKLSKSNIFFALLPTEYCKEVKNSV